MHVGWRRGRARTKFQNMFFILELTLFDTIRLQAPTYLVVNPTLFLLREEFSNSPLIDLW